MLDKTIDMFHASAQVSHPCVWISVMDEAAATSEDGDDHLFISLSRSVVIYRWNPTKQREDELTLSVSRVTRARGALSRVIKAISVILRDERVDSSAPVLRHLHLSVRPPSHDADCRSLTGHALCRSSKRSTERALAY